MYNTIRRNHISNLLDGFLSNLSTAFRLANRKRENMPYI